MEPMVVGALGIVIYCGYLTLKDLVSDLRQEGLLIPPLSERIAKWNGEYVPTNNYGPIPVQTGGVQGR